MGENNIPEENKIIENAPAQTEDNFKIRRTVFVFFSIIGVLVILLAAGTVFSNSNPTANTVSNGPNLSESSRLTLNVDIPCSGHASLIIYEVKKLSGVQEVKFIGSGNFDVYYDSSKISKEQILSATIFNEYPASLK